MWYLHTCDQIRYRRDLGPTDNGIPNTSHARQTETPDIYEFRFFAFAKS